MRTRTYLFGTGLFCSVTAFAGTMGNENVRMVHNGLYIAGGIGSAKTQDDLFGSEGILKELSKRPMERMLEAKMTHHLGYETHASEGKNTGNSRNGKTTKTIKTGIKKLFFCQF